MADLTPEQIKAARARGAATQVIPKTVTIEGLAEYAKQMIAAQQQLAAAIAALADSQLQSDEIVKAIRDLKLSVTIPPAPVVESDDKPTDWQIDFERDQRTGLMKSGIRFTRIIQ